jgi:hypothetical protein
MSENIQKESEYVTGDQEYSYRKRRGYFRYPKWSVVKKWRGRWDREKVENVLMLLGKSGSAEEISEKTGFGTLSITDVHGNKKVVPDLRGLDVTVVPREHRLLGGGKRNNNNILDLSYYHFEGARLTDLDLSFVNLSRAQLQKATLRRVNLKGSSLGKAHLEDADLRDAQFEDASLGHIRYTEDGFWWRGTILMETHLRRALYVDPVLERYAHDQYYLYVLKYKNRKNPIFRTFFFLWWVTSNYGKSIFLWALWSLAFAFGFAWKYYELGHGSFEIPNLTWNFQTVLYYSVVTFTTLGFGDVTPKTQEAAWWVMAEVIVGYIMLGGLISIFATKMAQRS